MCDRWHHCSTARKRRDYTKGLVPLGRFGRKPCVLQGCPQGCRIDPLTRMQTARPVRTGRRDSLTVWPVRRCLRSERVPDVTCLLYTSDAADERSSVDLGG